MSIFDCRDCGNLLRSNRNPFDLEVSWCAHGNPLAQHCCACSIYSGYTLRLPIRSETGDGDYLQAERRTAKELRELLGYALPLLSAQITFGPWHWIQITVYGGDDLATVASWYSKADQLLLGDFFDKYVLDDVVRA